MAWPQRLPSVHRTLQDWRGFAADEVIDALYGLPLEEFTRVRDGAARELRQAGRT